MTFKSVDFWRILTAIESLVLANDLVYLRAAE